MHNSAQGGRNLAAKDNSTEQDKNQTRDKAERIEYARRIERIETEKARERQLSTLKKGDSPVRVNLPNREEGRTRDIAAHTLAIILAEVLYTLW